MSHTMTAIAPVPVAEPTDQAPKRRRMFSGWVPAALTVVTLVFFLYAYGTPIADLIRFAAYLILGVVLPGTLLWRLAHGGPGSFAGDVAGGAATGYAIEVLAYIAARAVGAPLLVLIWPVTTIGAFLAVPKLRRLWRGSGERAHPAWSWTVALMTGFCALFGALRFFPTHGLGWPSSGHPYVDLPYYLAVLGEAKNHMPPTYAPVAAEPLHHHWFVLAEMAATSWVTGIEAMTLLYRLAPMALSVLSLVGVALVATRVAKRWWAGAGALLLAFCTAPMSPFKWTVNPVITGSSLDNFYLCPTQTFGAALFPVALLVVLRVMDAPGKGPFLLLAPLLATLIGAKATFVPMLIVGLCCAWLVRRTLRTAVALAMAGLTLWAGELLVYHGDHMGMRTMLLSTARATVVAQVTGLVDGAGAHRLPVLALVTAIVLVSWAVRFCLMAGLRRRLFRDPAIVLLAGIGAVGAGATFVFAHQAISQLYFIRSACPVLAILAVAGLAALIRTRRAAWSAAAGVAAGVFIGFVVPYAGSPAFPTVRTFVPGVLVPYGTMVALAVLAGLVARRAVAVTALAALTGLGAATFTRQLAVPRIPVTGQVVAEGALEAGRWLRDHSDPDDLVATDLHCYIVGPRKCDTREFSVSAYTERRVLVEGWAYTSHSHAEAIPYVRGAASIPYPDAGRLAANDLAFARPSETTVATLRDRYGVRWLFLDRRVHDTADELAHFATLRYAKGEVAVFEI